MLEWPKVEAALVEAKGGVLDDMTVCRDLRRRIRLDGNGPRSLVIHGNTAYVAHYFFDDIQAVDLATGRTILAARFGPGVGTEVGDVGERLFHDATLSHQGWQSCASCHPDGRVAALNWDLLNDGIGNPKNIKSLVLSHATPPVMSLGVRATAEQAVRSGFRNISFRADTA